MATSSSTPTAPSRKQKSAKPPVVAKTAGRPRADEAEARVDELAKIAGQLFLEKGYGKVSLEMIAREARVATRTIYVKFGGKAGLLGAILAKKREQHFGETDLAQDTRPLKEALNDFAERLYGMIMSNEAVALQRMLAAEACGNPEFVQTFYEQGPNRTRAAVSAYFARPDIRAQLRDDLPGDQLATFLLGTILGDHMSRMLLNPPDLTPRARKQLIEQRMGLFYRAVLK